MQVSATASTLAPPPAFWADSFSSAGGRGAIARMLASRAIRRAFNHPQTFGNYFTYGSAAAVAGSVRPFRDGSLHLSPEYSDLGYMWCQLGPPAEALIALSQSLSADVWSGYPPDLSDELRSEVSEFKFGRPRDGDFDVLGTEGAQGAIGYAFLAFLNPGDEVLITDPGYMHFATAPRLAGATVRAIPLHAGNRFRLDPDEVAAAITPRTKLLVLCDPINPFGTVQSRQELVSILGICERRGVLVLSNITHSTHRLVHEVEHVAASSLSEVGTQHVLSVTGLSKGYSLAALRLGFLAGHPNLLRAAAQYRMEITGIHIHPLAQSVALAAFSDTDYVPACTKVLRRNFGHLRETIERSEGAQLVVEPEYGFSTCVDVTATGVSAQELTVGLFEQGICVLAGDALGEQCATRLIRLNFSQPTLDSLERLRHALPIAIRNARTRKYLSKIQAFYRSKRSHRARKILAQLELQGVRRVHPAQNPNLSTSVPANNQKSGTAMIQSRKPSFVSQAELRYGPLDVLGPFFSSAYKAAANYGVHLTFGTFDELLKVNLANQKSWRALIPTFDPRLSMLSDENAFCIFGYDATGDIVATQACRLFDWRDTDFKKAAEDLSLFYSYPDWDRGPNETCVVTASSAEQVHGLVAFSGGAWYRRDFRGKYLSLILPRISRAYAFTRWSTDYTASMIQDSVLASGMGDRCGYTKIEWSVHVHGSPMGDINFAFVWMEPDELVDDLRRFEGLIATEADGTVRYRRA